MSYVEILTARNRLTWFASIVVLIGLVALLAVWYTPSTVRVDTEVVSIPFAIILLGAAWFSCIMTTMLSGTLSRDYAHLPYMWTRPIPRERIALGYMLVDCLTILIAFAILVGVSTLVLSLIPHLRVAIDETVWPALPRAIAVPLMWYGLVELGTSSTRGRTKALVGLSWAVFWGLIILDALNFGGALGVVILILNIFNPMAYLPQHHADNVNFSVGVSGAPTIPLDFNQQTILAYAIFIISCTLAIYLWKRMEA
jgi:hypothetical protein